MAKQHILRKGQTYVFTTGQYDSYMIEGFAKMTRDLDCRGIDLGYDSLLDFIVKHEYGTKVDMKEINYGMGFKHLEKCLVKGVIPESEWLYNIY